MQASEQKVLALLGILAEQSGEKVSSARLEFIAESLCELGAESAVAALRKLLESARRFPTVAEVKAVMGMAEPTARDAGNEIASRIITAIQRCGVPVGPKGQQALDDMLGPEARYVVQKLGGWAIVVDQSAENLTALRAQIRDLAESSVRTGQIETPEPRSLPGYADALAAAETKVDAPTLPEAKRLLLEDRKAALLKIREDLGAGKITDDEAMDLIALADQQAKIKGDEIQW